MQIDMHFYGVYALCRATGISSENAHIIAYASQFVDDAIEGKNIIFRKSQKALKAVMTSHKPLDYRNAIYGDQWKVWTSFHFLPGNESPNGKFEEKMICQQNSELANKVLKNAEDNISQPYGLYLAGIASHAFADTFAHFGFIGISTDRNRVKEDSIKIKNKRRNLLNQLNDELQKILSKGSKIIPVGHGSVGTHPDQPYLLWEYKYEKVKRPKIHRDNFTDFNTASYLLYNFYKRIVSINPELGNITESREWDTIKEDVKSILKKQANKDTRIKAWKKLIKDGKLFIPDNRDIKIHYKEKLWHIKSVDLKTLYDDQIVDLPLYKFQIAAQKQIELVNNYLKDNNITF